MNNNLNNLIKKVQKEYEIFIISLRKLDKDNIIERAYEIVTKADIITALSTGEYTEMDIQTIIQLDNPLNEIYTSWLEKDISIVGDIHETILELIDERLDSIREEDEEHGF
ncbi:UNVERIFIED_CONTAM: uncharacterized protein DUF3848 [Acetivibrio alkalicellulosi]